MQNLAILKVVRNKSFLFLWLGQVFSQIALNMMNFALVTRIYEATRSNTAVSLIVLSFGLPAVIFGMIAGVFVDRWDRRLVLFFCNILRAFAVLGFFFSSDAFFIVYILAFLISSITQFFVPAEAPAIPVIVSRDYLLTANSLFTLTIYASIITGYVLAGPVLGFLGTKMFFLLISGLFFISALFVRAVKFPQTGITIIDGIKEAFSKRLDLNKDVFQRVLSDFQEGASVVRSNKAVYSAVILMTISQAMISSLAALAPGFADRVLSIRITDASVFILGPAAAGLLLGALLVGQAGRKMSRVRLINLGIFSGGLFLFLLSIINILHFAMICLFFLGLANAFIDIPANTMLQENTKDEVRGRVYGVLTAMMGAASLLPTILAGILADFFGVGRVVLFMAILIFAYGGGRIIRQSKFLSGFARKNSQ